jgi:hypothetical protein
MASYTDQIPKFNPYIQQLPIEAMVQVGMEKQRRYDEGLQKIQTNIDNVAGLDVIRNVDKQYLQSKLNDLGSKLKTVAAGDFSNYQLVNSVGGMAKQIGKDSTIQNAVGSTAKYRKELTNRDAYKKEGKDSPSNDYVFGLGVDKWLNSNDVNTSFNTTYDQYTNWKKNSIDIIKGLTGDSTIKDDAFTVKVDSRGNPVLGADGKPELVITDAITRRKMAGVTAEQIQQALLVGLTPSDFKQMQNDSLYDYSNQDANQFKLTIKNSYDDKLKSFTEKRTIFENAKLSTKSNEQKKLLDNNIASLNKTIGSLTKEQNDLLTSIDKGNINGAKTQFGTYNSINGLSKAFSHADISETYETSPLIQAAQFRESKAQDWKKFTIQYDQTERFHKDDQYWKQEENKIARAKLKADTSGYGGLGDVVDQEDIPRVTLQTIIANVEKGNEELDTSKNKFLKQQGKDEAWLNQQKAAWEKNPNGVDAIVSKYFDSTTSKTRDIKGDEEMILRINNEATKKFGSIDQYIPKGSPNITINTPNTSYVYTPKDFVDFNQNFNRYQTYVSSGGPTRGNFVFDDVKAMKELSAKELYLYNIYKKNRQTQQPLTSSEKVIIENSNFYNQTANLPYNKILREINDYTTKEVSDRMTSSQGMFYTIPTGTPAQRKDMAANLAKFADRAEKQEGKLANSPNFNIADARDIATDPEAIFNISVSEGTDIQPSMYKISATGKGKHVDFKLSAEDKISMFGNDFESSPAIEMIRPYIRQMRKMASTGSEPYTTAWDNQTETTKDNGYLNKIDFPNVNSYGIKANLIQPVTGQFQLRLAVYDPVSKEWNNDVVFPKSNNLMLSEGVAPSMINMSDEVLFELVHGRIATPNELKELKLAKQKP